MDFRQLFLAQHARTHTAEVAAPDLSVQDNALREVTPEQMRQRPLPALNSLAWLLWHITRTEDIGVNLIVAERPQVVDAGDWSARLKVARRDFGAGMTQPEVDEFNERIDVAALLDYRAAVGRRTRELLVDLRPETLDEVIDADRVQRARDAGAFGPNAEWVGQRWLGKQKAFTLSHTVLAHSFLHLGQADIVRGLLGLPTI